MKWQVCHFVLTSITADQIVYILTITRLTMIIIQFTRITFAVVWVITARNWKIFNRCDCDWLHYDVTVHTGCCLWPRLRLWIWLWLRDQGTLRDRVCKQLSSIVDIHGFSISIKEQGPIEKRKGLELQVRDFAFLTNISTGILFNVPSASFHCNVHTRNYIVNCSFDSTRFNRLIESMSFLAIYIYIYIYNLNFSLTSRYHRLQILKLWRLLLCFYWSTVHVTADACWYQASPVVKTKRGVFSNLSESACYIFPLDFKRKLCDKQVFFNPWSLVMSYTPPWCVG